MYYTSFFVFTCIVVCNFTMFNFFIQGVYIFITSMGDFAKRGGALKKASADKYG